MKPDAIQVAVDILRELGLEDVARWVEHPDAVRELLKSGSTVFGEDERGPFRCTGCGALTDEAHQNWAANATEPMQHCPIAAAWRALGDPRGQADIERAHEEALRTVVGRDALSGQWVSFSSTPHNRIVQVEMLLRDGLITPRQARQVLEYPEGTVGIEVQPR